MVCLCNVIYKKMGGTLRAFRIVSSIANLYYCLVAKIRNPWAMNRRFVIATRPLG